MATVNDILVDKGSEVYRIEPDATVFEAITQMVDRNCGALLVMLESDIVGIITERDYLRKIAVAGRSSKTTTVREVMVSSLIVVEPDTDIDEALALITDQRIRHLPVVSDSQLQGMISIGDLVKYKTKAQAFQIKHLEEYISAR
ncbi:MAG: CBS domain-containing protein [Acidimicrobiia bacterium]|nr:CBS domain-containing protein [Acidimicrobiia bacterium]